MIMKKKEKKIYYPPHAGDLDISSSGIFCASVVNVYDILIDDYTYEDKSSDFWGS